MRREMSGTERAITVSCEGRGFVQHDWAYEESLFSFRLLLFSQLNAYNPPETMPLQRALATPIVRASRKMLYSNSVVPRPEFSFKKVCR